MSGVFVFTISKPSLKKRRHIQIPFDIFYVVPVTNVTFTPPISDTVTVTLGGSQTYTCVSGSCRPQARIEWYKDGMNVTTHTGSVSSDGDRFVITSSYTLTGAKGDSPATVQCRASNVDGMTPVQSALKNFVVQCPPDGPPVISGHTSSSALYVHDTLTLSCRQTGGNPLSTLTWTGVCGGIPDTDGSTGTESVSTIIITVTNSYNQGTCGCVSTHPQPQGQDRSEVTFTVHYPPSTPTVSQTPTHPWLEGESGTLSCSYTEGFPVLTRVEWFRNGRLQTGQTTPSITITSLTKDGNRAEYTCRVKNDFTDVKLTNLTSSVMYLNVEYKPLVTLTPTTLTVVEGQTAQVTCDAEGNPAPRLEWLRGGTPVQTGPGTSLTFTLGDVDRSETDNYTCRAEGVSSVQGRQLITQRMVSIVVQYPPDVTVVAPSGVEERDTNVQLLCQTLGEPNTLISQSWTQTIDQAFITDQFTYNTASHDIIVLAVVSMDDVGKYTCSVSNGVPDRNGESLQSNSAVLNVKAAAQFSNIDEYQTFSGEFQKPLVVRIPFYSNPPVTYVADLEWTRLTTGQKIIPSGDITFSLYNGEFIYLTIKQRNISFVGQAAVMTILSFDSTFVGDYNVTIYNDGRRRHSTSSFSITHLTEHPGSPTNFRVMDYTSSSITVEWNKGFNGGHMQTFVVMYRPVGGISLQTISVLEQQQLTYTKEITGLQPNTRYQLNLYSYNKVGNSSLSSIIGIIGKKQQQKATSNPNTAPMILFILASLMLLVAGIHFLCFTYRLKLKRKTPYKRKHKDKPGEHGHQTDGSHYNDLNLDEREPPSTYESIGGGTAANMDEEVISGCRRMYESLGMRNDVSVYDELKGPAPNTYENTVTI
ncbi:synaptogenesis protein syg-2-like [Argopecten irradians]|uniref:synaptogenesis protein syg-2-like n=1 Tax=Argopecten irradians TaxID=31199 RepID=UPI00371E312A